MKNLSSKISLFLALIVFHSCSDNFKNTNVSPEPKSRAIISRDGTKLLDTGSNDCKEIFGYVISPDGLILNATDNEYELNFMINDINYFYVGKKFSDDSDKTLRFSVTFSQISTSRIWHSHLENNNGVLTITAFDPNTSLISCEFSFAGYLLDRMTGELTTKSAQFSGVMTDVRIYPNSDAWLDCGNL